MPDATGCTKRNAHYRDQAPSGSAIITLKVHPLFGQTVRIRSRHGPAALWVETAGGRVAIVPRSWTDRGDNAIPLEVDGRAVRLAPEALRALAAWVDDRRGVAGASSPDRRKVGHGRELDMSSDHGRVLSATTGAQVRHASAPRDAAVVEQAGAPGTDGGGTRRTGGES